MTLFEYIEKYGDKNFNEVEFNEVDNVILSLVSYIDFTDIVPKYKNTITLEEAANKFFRKHSERELRSNIFSIRSAIRLFREIKNYKRYNTLLLHNYERTINENEQFGAVCIDISDDLMYVSFEGTNEAVIGWKEDFLFAYRFPTPSQDDAIIYLEKVVGFKNKRIIVGGHSKGGNLALIAALYSNFWVKNKIEKIYSNDGPGFLKEQIDTSTFAKIKDRYIHIVPHNSIVGILLYNTNYKVISSTGLGILGHDALTWQVDDTTFIDDKLNKSSEDFRDSLITWLETYNEEERKKCIDELFMTLEDNDINSLIDIKKEKMSSIYKIIKSSSKISSDSKKMLSALIALIFSDYSDIIKEKLGLKK